MPIRGSTAWLVGVTVLSLAAAAAAQSTAWEDGGDSGTLDAAAESAKEELTEIYGWVMPTAEEQLAADTTPLPPMQAAIFVPAMSDPQDEPEVLVFERGRLVATGRTGERIIVTPGNYSLRVGSGTVEQMVEVPSVVAGEGLTRVVTPSWGSLRIEVVDQNNVPHRGEYEIVRVRDRELYGIGLGADTLQAERLQTWILAPGLYRIIQPGASYRSRTNFATVAIPEGGLVNFRLVEDPLTLDFLGAGVVTAEEIGRGEGVTPWSRTLTVGVSAGLSHTSQVVGLPNQITINGDLFVDSYLTYDDMPNFFAGIVDLTEGFVQIRPEEDDALPLQKSRDRLRLDLLYTYFLNDFLGPYASAGLVTGVFPTEIVVSDDTTVLFTNSDGTTTTQTVPASESFRVGEWFSPMQVREGLGFNFRLFRAAWGRANFRLGTGFRQNLFNDQFIDVDVAETPEVEYQEQEDFNQEGVEAVLTAYLRFTRFITYTTEAEYFSDFTEFDAPSINWENNLSFRLWSFVALDYNLDIFYLPQGVEDDIQLSQNVLLRFSWDLL